MKLVHVGTKIQRTKMRNKFSVVLLVAALGCQGAFAQTRSARVGINASNTDFPATGGGLGFPTIEEYSNDDGVLIEKEFDTTFSGLDQDGAEAVMGLSGTASASVVYGTIRTRASGALTNSFYNSENTPFHNSQTGDTDFNGVPDIFNVQAQAGWTDKLAAGGTANNYISTWIFDVTGSTTGSWAFSYLQVKIGNNPAQGVVFEQSTVNQRVRFSGFAIGNGQEDVDVSVFTTFQPQSQLIGQGATASGASNFGNTVKFAGVELRDLNGNLVNTTITSASGYTYNVVPEPASMIALGAGIAALIRRKKSH